VFGHRQLTGSSRFIASCRSNEVDGLLKREFPLRALHALHLLFLLLVHVGVRPRFWGCVSCLCFLIAYLPAEDPLLLHAVHLIVSFARLVNYRKTSLQNITMFHQPLQLLFYSLVIGLSTLAHAQENAAITPAPKAPASIAYANVVDVTITKTIEVPYYPNGDKGAGPSGLLYDTNSVLPSSTVAMTIPMSLIQTAYANSTKPTLATALAGSASANRTGTAKPSSTAKSLGTNVGGRVARLWESLIVGVAVGFVLFC